MRSICFTLLFTSFLALAAEDNFSAENHSFDDRFTVKVFEVPISGEAEKTRKICFANFHRRGRKLGQPGVAILRETADCLNISNFGGDSSLFVGGGVLEGPLGNEAKLETLRTEIKDRVWETYLKPIVIFSETGKSPGGDSIYHHICILDLRLVGADPDRPLKQIFCKAGDPIDVPSKNERGEIERNRDGSVKMVTTRICPLPAKCMSKEWAIQPTLEIMPDTDEDLAPHARRARRQAVHE